ncbi:MAG: DEAD/DEAH box helicase [Lachnospiraceae bacterium]
MSDIKWMPHQEQVLNSTDQYNRVAYYLDMGLGKTFVGAEKLWNLNNALNLLVCQKSKIDDWVDHFKKYYPKVIVCNLTKKSEAIRFRTLVDTIDLYNTETVLGIINYELAFRRTYLNKLSKFTLMLDESSLICNENAKRSKFILKLNPESVVLLSGTPTAGKYEKLWSQITLLGWKISKKAFYRSYVDTTWVEDYGTGYKREVIVGYKNVEHLKKKLANIGAVFMKTDEVIELPEQIEQNIMLHITKDYKYFIKNNYLLLDTLNLKQWSGDDSDYYGEDTTPNIELVGDNGLTKMLYARQLCGQYHKEKLQALKDLVESTEDRIIIFYNFTEELNRMKNHLDELQRPYSVLNGKVKDLTAYENESDSITFIQYQAGAMGGNYQKANKMIYYTLPLGKGSCDLWEQSKKRIHRIGQAKPCFYYYLLVKGSVEENNLKSLKVGKDYTDELFT